MNTKVYVDWGKLAQIALIIVSVTLLALTDHISESTLTLVVGTAAGYIFGNGKSVRAGHPQAPLIGLRETEPE